MIAFLIWKWLFFIILSVSMNPSVNESLFLLVFGKRHCLDIVVISFQFCGSCFLFSAIYFSCFSVFWLIDWLTQFTFFCKIQFTFISNVIYKIFKVDISKYAVLMYHCYIPWFDSYKIWTHKWQLSLLKLYLRKVCISYILRKEIFLIFHQIKDIGVIDK